MKTEENKMDILSTGYLELLKDMILLFIANSSDSGRGGF
jgi:hypothetical protein